MLVHNSLLPPWHRNCLQDRFFVSHRIIRIDGSRIHVRCSLAWLGRCYVHLSSLDTTTVLTTSPGMSRVSLTERLNLLTWTKAASPEEADEVEEMTAAEIAVDGYYEVVGIARHEYKKGWKFLTLWNGYRLSGITGEHMSASCEARWDYQSHLSFLPRWKQRESAANPRRDRVIA